MATMRKEFLLLCVLVIGQTYAQSGSSDKQIRLEDIERDNLNSQKDQASVLNNNNYHPAAQAHQQQIAAYQQQQYYLQQLQQQQQQASAAQQPQPHPSALQGAAPPQVLLPQQVPYNALPIMIIQQPLVDQLAQYYLMQQHLAALQYQAVPQAVQAIPPGLAHPGLVQPQVVHILPQQQLQLQQQQAQAVQQQLQFQQQPQTVQAIRAQTTNKPFRPSPPLAPAQPRPPTQTLVYTQQHYNPYNTIYQQNQQQKFLTGVKSTPAPTIKDSQAPLQATQYATYKSF